jgi:fibronectin type 3 domain-containing protein
MEEAGVSGWGGGSRPSTPTGVQAWADSSHSITISWYWVSNANEYYIYRSQSSSGHYSYIASTYSTSFTDYGLSSGETYYYRVTAWNGNRESPRSDWVSAMTYWTSGTPPGTPTGLSAWADGSSSIYLSWNWVDNAIGYRIYESVNSWGPFDQPIDVYDKQYTRTNLLPGRTYYYVVTAWNNSGESWQSSLVWATTSGTIEGTPPSTPTNVSAWENSSSSITISWDSVNNASHYIIYWSNTGGSSWSYLTELGGTSFIHGGLIAGTSYIYIVHAINSYGWSPESNWAYATISGSAGFGTVIVYNGSDYSWRDYVVYVDIAYADDWENIIYYDYIYHDSSVTFYNVPAGVSFRVWIERGDNQLVCSNPFVLSSGEERAFIFYGGDHVHWWW